MIVASNATTMFFLPDRVAGKSADPSIQKYFPETGNWESGTFYTNGLNAPYYVARAKHERAAVIGCSGLNTHYLLGPEQVKYLNDAGISIVWMALPKVDGKKSILDNYLPLAREFFTSRNSPANLLARSDVPRFVLTHSTGGQLFFHLLHEPDTQRKLRGTFSAAVHVTPYFDTAHASRDHAPAWRSKIFERYMSHLPDLSPNTRLIAGGYIRLNDYLESLQATLLGKSDRYPPTFRGLVSMHWALVTEAGQALGDWVKGRKRESAHPGLDSACGQILDLRRSGQALTANFNVKAAKAVPSIFVIGDRDNFACPQTALDVAAKIDAQVVMAKGGFHDPLSTHPQLLDSFIAKVDECESRRAARAAEPYFYGGGYEEELPELPWRHRIGAQTNAVIHKGARLLSMTANLF